MSKGSNIRRRDIPKEQYDKHWDRIFQSGKNSDCEHSVQLFGGGHPEVQQCTKCGEHLLRGKSAKDRANGQ